LQKKIDREAQALNDANKDSNLKEMAVKITKMGPEIHAAYVKDKKNSRSEEVAAGGSSAGNTPGIGGHPGPPRAQVPVPTNDLSLEEVRGDDGVGREAPLLGAGGSWALLGPQGGQRPPLRGGPWYGGAPVAGSP